MVQPRRLAGEADDARTESAKSAHAVQLMPATALSALVLAVGMQRI